MLTSSFCQSYLKSGSWSCFDAPILYYHCAQFRIALKIYRAFGVCPPTTNENAGSKKKKKHFEMPWAYLEDFFQYPKGQYKLIRKPQYQGLWKALNPFHANVPLP